VVSKLTRPVHASVPPFVSLCYTCTHGPYNEPGPGFLGVGQSALRPLGPSREDMVLQGVTLGRFSNRKALLGSMDRLRRDLDAGSSMQGMDVFTDRAMQLLTSSRLVDALD